MTTGDEPDPGRPHLTRFAGISPGRGSRRLGRHTVARILGLCVSSVRQYQAPSMARLPPGRLIEAAAVWAYLLATPGAMVRCAERFRSACQIGNNAKGP